jgi:hypothetical protein
MTGGSPAPIDRPILDAIQGRLRSATQFKRVEIETVDHVASVATIESEYVPDDVETIRLVVRWYTNDDFAIHYRETRPEGAWEQRWDRHPNPHNDRDHFHPPPYAATLGRNASWPDDYRDVMQRVLEDVEDRIRPLWPAMELTIQPTRRDAPRP